MAKISLYNGTNGARPKIIPVLKSRLSHVILHDTLTLALDYELDDDDLIDRSSDQSTRVKELQFTASNTIYQTENDFTDDDSKITNFYVKTSRTVNKFAFMKPIGGGEYKVTGIITFDNFTPTKNSAYFVNEFKIEVKDQV